MAKINEENFNILKSMAEDYIENELVLPEFDASSEAAVFTQLKSMRSVRNTLIKYSLAFRKIKRFFAKEAETQLVLRQSQQAAMLLRYADEFKLCKTKEERDAVMSSHIPTPTPDYASLEKQADSILLDVNIAIQECQKVFDEYELTFNFQKTASMGYLLSQASSKLNDMIK